MDTRNVLRLRIDMELAHMLSMLSMKRRTTQSALVREMIVREWREHERIEATDKLRAARAMRVVTLSERDTKKAAWKAAAPERAREEYEAAAAARAAELERERVQREEEAIALAERKAREDAERAARHAESEPWELIRSDVRGGGPNGGWTASGEKWLDKNILRLPRGTAWTKLHRGVVVSSGVTETEPLPEVWPSRG